MKAALAKRLQSSLYPVQQLRRRAQAWAVKLRVNPRLIRIQEMRGAWGSCSDAGTVTLAIGLLETPDAFQDYVIVHELLHLRLAGHGRLFKALLSAHVPDWQRLDATSQQRPRQAQVTATCSMNSEPSL